MEEEYFVSAFDFDDDTILRNAERAMEQAEFTHMLAQERQAEAEARGSTIVESSRLDLGSIIAEVKYQF